MIVLVLVSDLNDCVGLQHPNTVQSLILENCCQKAISNSLVDIQFCARFKI